MQSNPVSNVLFENRPHCPLLPQSGMHSGQIRTYAGKRLRYQDVSRITRSVNFEQLERVAREMPRIARVYPSNDCELAKYTKKESVQIETV